MELLWLIVKVLFCETQFCILNFRSWTCSTFTTRNARRITSLDHRNVRQNWECLYTLSWLSVVLTLYWWYFCCLYCNRLCIWRATWYIQITVSVFVYQKEMFVIKITMVWRTCTLRRWCRNTLLCQYSSSLRKDLICST